MRAIEVSRFGGPEVLELVECPDPVPTEGLELLRVSAAGVNYADTHATENSYLRPQSLPFIPGMEVVGHLADGRRVCGFTATEGGGYAELALVSPAAVFDVPDSISDAAALSLLVQGITAWHLLRTSARMQPGDAVLVYAAAGGVGSLAVQLARIWGAGRIIAVASTPQKQQLARKLGADIAVSEITPDVGKVDIVLDMVGGSTTEASLAALSRFGRLVIYGSASREAAAPLEPRSLMVGSRSVIGFWLADCIRVDPAGMVAGPLAELIGLVVSGELVPQAGPSYPLAQARQAHEDMRARRTTGKVVLTP